jgi:hypothetical protein
MIITRQCFVLPVMLVLTGVVGPAAGQTRSWQQTARTYKPAVAPASATAVAAPQTARAPAVTTAAAPRPSAPPYLPVTSANAAARNPVLVAQNSPMTSYPLPPGSAMTAQPTLAPPAVTQYNSTTGASPWLGSGPASFSPTATPPVNGRPFDGGAPAYQGVNSYNSYNPGPSYGAAPAFGPLPAYNSAPVADPGMWEQGGGGCGCNDCQSCDPCCDSCCGKRCGPWFVSVSWLYLTRDVPNNVEYAALSDDPAQSVLNSERVGTDEWMNGIEARVGRSLGDRWGIEGVYWWSEGMEERVTVRDEANRLVSRLDFENVLYEGTPLSAIYDNSHEQRLFRETLFENIEVNLLRQAVIHDPNDRFGMMMFTGARYFRFEETLKYDAVEAGREFAENDFNTQSDYWVRELNRLIGWQIGARGYLMIGNKMRIYAMPRFGLFANNISQRHHVCMVIDEDSEKLDIALLGQLDAGVSFEIFRCCSVYGGYRAMGFSGIASADDNVSRSFVSLPALETVNSAGSLILHGWQAGVQYQF